MTTVCELNKCCGCMACVDICSKQAIKIEDTLNAYNAVIDTDRCIGCNACHNVCQQNQNIAVTEPVAWYQGWATEATVRNNGTSGGIAGAIEKHFIETGGIVCSCKFQNGEFGFDFAKTIDQLKGFAGSKYVKSNPAGVYKNILNILKQGKPLLFVGLPCQTAAVRLYIPEKFHSELYTVDLICHGTPSPKTLEMFLAQYKETLKKMHDVKFRKKGSYQLFDGDRSIATEGVDDRYMIAFLHALTYTENCYHCKYARRERNSDITLGDSWGCAYSADEFKKGISLMLCSTEKGKSLLGASELYYENADINVAIENNAQLQHPPVAAKGRTQFFDSISNGQCFNKTVKKFLTKECIKQQIKEIMIKFGLRKNKVRGK